MAIEKAVKNRKFISILSEKQRKGFYGRLPKRLQPNLVMVYEKGEKDGYGTIIRKNVTPEYYRLNKDKLTFIGYTK